MSFSSYVVNGRKPKKTMPRKKTSKFKTAIRNKEKKLGRKLTPRERIKVINEVRGVGGSTRNAPKKKAAKKRRKKTAKRKTKKKATKRKTTSRRKKTAKRKTKKKATRKKAAKKRSSKKAPRRSTKKRASRKKTAKRKTTKKKRTRKVKRPPATQLSQAASTMADAKHAKYGHIERNFMDWSVPDSKIGGPR